MEEIDNPEGGERGGGPQRRYYRRIIADGVEEMALQVANQPCSSIAGEVYLQA